LLALTAVRGGEIRGATPEEFEGLGGATPIWRIPPATRMKTAREHVVPLAAQAVQTVLAAQSLLGPRPRLLFPSVRHAHRPMSENAIGYLLNRAGYHGRHVPHGFRAAFSTIMNERYREDRAVIDLMLAHAPRDRVEAAYNRAAHMERRVELAQKWANTLLEGMPDPWELIGLPRRQDSNLSSRSRCATLRRPRHDDGG
jgi:integrase